MSQQEKMQALECLLTGWEVVSLQHKSPIIEALQDSMSELQEHFAETYRNRVEKDEAEEMEPCSASVAAALDVSLISQSSPPFAQAAPCLRADALSKALDTRNGCCHFQYKLRSPGRPMQAGLETF